MGLSESGVYRNLGQVRYCYFTGLIDDHTEVHSQLIDDVEAVWTYTP